MSGDFCTVVYIYIGPPTGFFDVSDMALSSIVLTSNLSMFMSMTN